MQRIEELCRDVVPAKALAADAKLPLKEKKGVEYGVRRICWRRCYVIPVAGTQLCNAMLLPRDESLEKLEELEKRRASVQRERGASKACRW